MEALCGSEYRRNPRVPARRALMLEVRSTSEKSISHPATTHDVSRGGLRVVMETCDLAPGSALTVSLPIGELTLVLNARVAWMGRCPEGFRLGLKLHPHPSDARSRRAFDSFVLSSERAFFTNSELSRPF
jgi:hypothetical protein